MRPIKFRAKALQPGADNNPGEWVYGYYEEIKTGIGRPRGIMHIFNDWNLNSQIEVDPETLGQFTGPHDKNGVEIYEGDILGYKKVRMWVIWFEQRASFVGRYKNNFAAAAHKPAMFHKNMDWVATHGEVLGNVWENKELLNP